MLKLPFFSELETAENILVAGAGGGFDIFSGLPLYFGLRAAGKNVHLANLSFSFLPPIRQDRLSPALLRVSHRTPRFSDYFPEQFLAEWFFDQQSEAITIYCFERTGYKPVFAGYKKLVKHLNLDTIILVDGGTDSLMRGDEDGLGTPQEDMVSIAAVNALDVKHKMLACLGFGVDHYHGVSNAHTLKAIAELTRQNGFLGAFSITKDMPEAQKFRAATEHVFSQIPNNMSIVSSSILSALAGHYGDHHATHRTYGSTLWINPLMTVYWCFQLSTVAERVLYLDQLKKTGDYMDVRRVIKTFQQNQGVVQQRGNIPN